MQETNNEIPCWTSSITVPSNPQYCHLVVASIPLAPCERVNHHPGPMCYIFVIHGSQSLRCLSPVCAICARFLSTPRLPVASYKNSFSMTEWRIRLEGSGQSSGTPFKDICPRSVLLLPLYLWPPLCGKKKGSRAVCFLCCQLSSEIVRNFFFRCCVKILYRLLLLITACQMISDTYDSSQEGQAHALITSGAELIILNSFMLDCTCLDRTYLIIECHSKPRIQTESYFAVLFERLYFRLQEYSTMYKV